MCACVSGHLCVCGGDVCVCVCVCVCVWTEVANLRDLANLLLFYRS